MSEARARGLGEVRRAHSWLFTLDGRNWNPLPKARCRDGVDALFFSEPIHLGVPLALNPRVCARGKVGPASAFRSNRSPVLNFCRSLFRQNLSSTILTALADSFYSSHTIAIWCIFKRRRAWV